MLLLVSAHSTPSPKHMTIRDQFSFIPLGPDDYKSIFCICGFFYRAHFHKQNHIISAIIFHFFRVAECFLGSSILLIYDAAMKL